MLAIVTGTWCPNCHDEAQYLIQLDKQYRDKGLRIVALNFEEVEQQASLKRAKAFVAQYGVKYQYLQAGAPEEMWEKVPQLLNLNTWPATVFVGRDGTVRAVHAGFASPATGDVCEPGQGIPCPHRAASRRKSGHESGGRRWGFQDDRSELIPR